jgi:hypothetical protein
MHGFYYALLWIRDILIWIWIRGSRSLTYGSGSCFLGKWLTRCQQKISFFAYTSVFKDKKSKRSHKIVKSRFFLLFLLVDGFCWYMLISMSCLFYGLEVVEGGGGGERRGGRGWGGIMSLGEEGGVWEALGDKS